jgi:hypothetical protein
VEWRPGRMQNAFRSSILGFTRHGKLPVLKNRICFRVLIQPVLALYSDSFKAAPRRDISWLKISSGRVEVRTVGMHYIMVVFNIMFE